MTNILIVAGFMFFTALVAGGVLVDFAMAAAQTVRVLNN